MEKKTKYIINKQFVELIIVVIFLLGILGSVILFICASNGIGGTEMFAYAGFMFLGTCILCCFLIIGVLIVAELEKSNKHRR